MNNPYAPQLLRPETPQEFLRKQALRPALVFSDRHKAQLLAAAEELRQFEEMRPIFLAVLKHIPSSVCKTYCTPEQFIQIQNMFPELP